MTTPEKARWMWYPGWLMLAITPMMAGAIGLLYEHRPAIPGLEPDQAAALTWAIGMMTIAFGVIVRPMMDLPPQANQ